MVIYKTHLYALVVVTEHGSDDLKSDTDVGGDAIYFHAIISLNNLEEKDSIISSKVYPKIVGNKSNVE